MSSVVRLRNSPRSIAADYLNDSARILLLAFTIFATTTINQSAFAIFLSRITIAYSAIVLASPPLRYLFTFFELREDGLVFRNAFLVHTERIVPWRSATSLNIETPWAHRLLGIVRVTITQTGSDEHRVTLWGIDPTVMKAIRTRFNQEELPRPNIGPLEPHPEAKIYEASLGALLLMAFTHGQVLVLGSAAIIACWDMLESLGLQERLGGMLRVVPLGAIAGAAILLVFTLGTLATLVRYHSFRVERSTDGQLITRRGLFNTIERRIETERVLGVVVRQNLLELLLRRATLGVLTRDADVRVTTNLVLPSAPVAQVESTTKAHFAKFWEASKQTNHSAASALTRVAAVAAVVATTSIALTILSTPSWMIILASSAAWIIPHQLGAARARCLLVDVETSQLTVDFRFISLRRTAILLEAVHAVGEVNLHKYRWIWAMTFTGGPRIIISLTPDKTTFPKLSYALSRPHLTQRCPR